MMRCTHCDDGQKIPPDFRDSGGRLAIFSCPECTACISHDVIVAALRSPDAAATALPSGALEALKSYQQADDDGVMVLVSRQALDEAIAVLGAPAQEAWQNQHGDQK